MRTIETHKVNPANDLLTIEVHDQPGHGGACHRYLIKGPVNPRTAEQVYTWLPFQDGPIDEAGVNGITHEALLAVLIDRLEGFQSGPYANEYNDGALMCLHHAQEFLQRRTKERMDRGVEGTHHP